VLREARIRMTLGHGENRIKSIENVRHQYAFRKGN